MSLLDYDALTFDCYGTLIDWETGLLRAIADALPEEDRPADEVLETFGRFESEEETAAPALPYPKILGRVLLRLADAWGLGVPPGSAEAFGASVGSWPAFSDSPQALQVLKRHYRLVILSNVDRASFRASQRRLGVDFDFVFTAQDIGSYKPDPRNFEHMLEKLATERIARDRILHTAQSLHHDHVPAARLGLATCWIDRRHAKPGWGATVAPGEKVEVTYRFPSLAEMATAVETEVLSLPSE